MTISPELIGDIDMTWQDDARCLDTHPDLFFPQQKEAGMYEDAAEAVAFCQPCPVKRECLVFAAKSEYTWRHGVWGGTVYTYRRRLTRHRVLTGEFEMNEIPDEYARARPRFKAC